MYGCTAFNVFSEIECLTKTNSCVFVSFYTVAITVAVFEQVTLRFDNRVHI